jgi:DNA-directed RNA polymerase alpha subunit
MKEEELFQIRNFGRTALDEVKEKLVEGGFVQPEEMGPV